MSKINNHTFDVAGVKTRVMLGGDGRRSLIFLHGGIPGVTPYVGGSHLWGQILELFAESATVVAIDLLGSGLTDYPLDRPLTLDDINTHVDATLRAIELPPGHVIGHDLGGLTALWLGLQKKPRVTSVGVVGSAHSTSSGEAWDDLTLASAPLPLLGRESQRWAFDRLSATVAHIDTELLDAAEAAAANPGIARVAAAMRTPLAQAAFSASLGRVRGAMWAQAREAGYPLPVQIIWGAQDPLTTLESGHSLFATLGQKQRFIQFHLVNEAGSFVHREQPAQFKRLVTAFLDGLDQAEARADGR
jgi:pimeloyl-ACP methyl ester carboxylesterase